MAKRRKSRSVNKIATMQPSSNMCYACCPNHKRWGLILLLVGLIFLFQDYTGGPVWWKVSWYTLVFLLLGLCWSSKR